MADTSEPKCPTCGAGIGVMVEYDYTHPERYDGVSEYRCEQGHRWGRWSGRVLTGSDYERRWGREEKQDA